MDCNIRNALESCGLLDECYALAALNDTKNLVVALSDRLVEKDSEVIRLNDELESAQYD